MSRFDTTTCTCPLNFFLIANPWILVILTKHFELASVWVLFFASEMQLQQCCNFLNVHLYVSLISSKVRITADLMASLEVQHA
jgi:hypothetical protein